MKFIAGLGNPGPDYEKTRHNAGFMAVDHLMRRHGLSGGKVKNGTFTLSAEIHGQPVIIIKPLSYMNLSGHPIRAVLEFYKATIGDLLVVHDDIDLVLGDVRYKTGGGHGGHNGLKSIMAQFGSPDFHRLRIGVNRPPAGKTASDHVLDPFEKGEKSIVEESLGKAVNLLEERFLV
ncbi:MAG: aminoacyl-tRNA hydrolase [Nitrospinae bacterium]|nr:aminoacyl-tRNA hydrolase [Nitrospinota bacterium]